jgi:formylglycine-generating enzyme required for sulfatase activity
MPALRCIPVVIMAATCVAGGAAAQDAFFVRGDVNDDGSVDLSDAVSVVRGLFGGAAIRCDDALDANDDGAMDIADAVYLLEHLFAHGPALPAPGRTCGTDSTIDGLGCRTFSGCPRVITIELRGSVPLEMVACPAGVFLMGRYAGEQQSWPNEDWQREVTLRGGFYLGKYEVTKRQWQAVMGTAPWVGQDYVGDDPDSPAVYVSWDDAQAFVAAVNDLGQGTFSLPTEAQWEYACRAGTTTRFYFGDDPGYARIGDCAWYSGNALDAGAQYAHVVGQKLPNGWGLYDVLGNVEEWCQDWWEEQHSAGAVVDPSGPPSGSLRVYRGGSWFNAPRACRSAYRYRSEPGVRYGRVGFRLARTSP